MNINDIFYQRQIREQLAPLAKVAQGFAEELSEKDLQAQCEGVLVRAGYHRLTEGNMVNFAHTEHAGWFGHWPNAIGNPIVSDLVIWNRDMTRTLMIELKPSAKAHKRKAQKAAITQRLWKCAYSADEFAGILAEWRSLHHEDTH